jgi:hypothetical protein
VEFQERFERVNHAARLKAGSETRPLRLGFTPSGAIVDLNERDDDAARAQSDEESRRRLREQLAAERAVEAAELAEHERARDAAFRSELPPGVPG